MIPLRDDIPARTTPFVNLGLIALNVVFFLWELGLGSALEPVLMQVAVVPRLYTGGDGVLGPYDLVVTTFEPSLAFRTFVSMFLHGGLAHLFGNMLYLWIFGDNVEDRLGHLRYLVFYLLCGWLASYAHIFFDPRSRVPAIGASGAIAGVLGAYFLLYPRARVVIAWPPPFLFFLPLTKVPALVVLGLWFVQQFLFGLGSLGSRPEEGGVAFWAHAGGFAAGMLLVGFFARKERRPVARDYWWEAPRYARDKRRERRWFDTHTRFP